MKRDVTGDDSGAFMSKLTVEDKMNEVEALGISPTIKVVRDALGGTTATIGEQVTAVNASREAEIVQAICDDLLTVSKKLHSKARESAKRLYADQITSLTNELVSIKCDRDRQLDQVAQLTAQSQEIQVRCEAAEQLFAREIVAHEESKRDLATTKETLAAARLEQEHTSLQLAHTKEQVILLQRDKQAADANESQLQRQLEMLAENLQSERVACLSAQELREGERKAHRDTQTTLAVCQEELAVVRTELAHLRGGHSSLKEEVEAVNEALLAEQQKVYLGQQSADVLKREIGGLRVQLELLIERVRPFSPEISKEFEVVMKRGRT